MSGTETILLMTKTMSQKKAVAGSRASSLGWGVNFGKKGVPATTVLKRFEQSRISLPLDQRLWRRLRLGAPKLHELNLLFCMVSDQVIVSGNL